MDRKEKERFEAKHDGGKNKRKTDHRMQTDMYILLYNNQTISLSGDK
jgi:hypothetical protein